MYEKNAWDTFFEDEEAGVKRFSHTKITQFVYRSTDIYAFSLSWEREELRKSINKLIIIY
jgi:hypothetical protein